MQKKNFSKISLFTTAVLLSLLLPSCAVLDLFHDKASENDPVPESSPYLKTPSDNEHSSHFAASVTDQMVTDLTMQIVTNSFTGNYINSVIPDKKMRKNSPESRKALLYGNETLQKLIRTGLLFRNKHSNYYFVSSILQGKWILSCVKNNEVIFSGTVPLSEKKSPEDKK